MLQTHPLHHCLTLILSVRIVFMLFSFPFNFFFYQMHAIIFVAHHQQLPADGTLVFLDLFRRLLALQAHQLLILFAQLATIRSYSQFFQRPLFIDTGY